ncbi:MAG: FliA/WhiG family RNA polymerase sigma factor [Armatimonadetes bacterium]|nr:FliA/WhiG family RNA polymerase sigma factor [Armatimonadota bacterium]
MQLGVVARQVTATWCATPALREEAIRDHVHIVKYVVGRITAQLPANVDREDLVSAGILGLIKAVDRFDPGRGVKFETYATTVVRGEVMESLRAKDWAPRSMRRKLRQLAEVVSQLEAELLRAPDEEEVADAMGMALDEYHRFLSDASTASVASLEELLAGEEPQDPTACAPGEQSEEYADPLAIVERAELRRLVAEAVMALPDRERTIMSLYYEQELTLKEIGQIMGVTESRVCQIHTQATARLRAAIQRELRVA